MNRFKNIIPKTWAYTTIGEAYAVIGGGTPSTGKPGYWNGSIPWITSADIEGVRQINIRKHVTEKGIAASTTNLVPPKTLLVVTRVGLGKIGISEMTICFSQDLQGLVQKPELVCPEYTLYFLSYELQILKYEGRGTTISGITKKQLKDLGFPLPPISEQKRIVAKIEELFSELDKGIESFKTAREQLKVYRQALLKHAFEGKLTVEWREANKDKLETANALLKRIQAERAERYRQQVKEWEKSVKEWEKNGKKGSKPGKPSQPKQLPPLTAEELTELPELPKGWVWEKNENYLFEVKDGTHDTPKYLERGIPFVTQKNIRNDRLDMQNVSYISSGDHETFYKRSNVQSGDLIVSMIGHCRGQCCLVDTDAVFSIKNVGLFKFFIRLQSNRFLKYYYQSTDGLNLVLSKSKGGAQSFIGLTELRAWPVPVCSLIEQNKIVEELESKLSEIDNLDQTITTALQQAESLRQSILKKAFSGRLVAQDPNDEPAAKLLARIKAERTVVGAGSKPALGTGTTNRKSGRPTGPPLRKPRTRPRHD